MFGSSTREILDGLSDIQHSGHKFHTRGAGQRDEETHSELVVEYWSDERQEIGGCGLWMSRCGQLRHTIVCMFCIGTLVQCLFRESLAH